MSIKTRKVCSLCGETSSVVISLPLYIGTKNIEACLACRLVLTEVAKGIKHVAVKGSKSNNPSKATYFRGGYSTHGRNYLSC